MDQSQLLGLIASRLLYVASATEDPWADPASEFESCVRVGPVYALFGCISWILQINMARSHPDVEAGQGVLAARNFVDSRIFCA